MSEENIIKAIEIEIAGVTVKVTPEQLVKLHGAIGELLNIKTEKVVEKQTYIPYVPYQQPTWYWNPNPMTPLRPYYGTITVSNQTATLAGATANVESNRKIIGHATTEGAFINYSNATGTVKLAI